MRYVVFLLGVVFLLASCSAPVDSSARLTGSEGVVLSITSQPGEIFAGEEFSLTYRLENKGSTPVFVDDPGRLVFSFDNYYLEYVDRIDRFRSEDFWLQPRTVFAAGEVAFVTAYFRAREIQRSSPMVNTAVTASVCYLYTSSFTTQVCLEATREADAGSIICRSTPIIIPSPAAPVGVDSITTRTARTADGQVLPQFRLNIRNLDRGVPATSSCSGLSGEAASGLNNVHVRAFLLDEELICLGSGVDGAVRLQNGRGIVTCSVSEASSLRFGASSTNYLSLLSVDIEYTYRQSVRSDLRILR